MAVLGVRSVPYGSAAVSLADAPLKAVVRIVLIIVAVALCLYLIYLLRKPITWVLVAGFIAVALSPPVNVLSQHMRRGFAIGLVYLGLLGIVVLLTALLVPPIVNEATDLADNAPSYVQDVREYVQKNKRLNEINQDYQITDKLEEEAAKLPDKIGEGAGVLRDIGFGIVNGVFAFVTIMVLAAFILSGGPDWRRRAMALQPPERAERLDVPIGPGSEHAAAGRDPEQHAAAAVRHERGDEVLLGSLVPHLGLGGGPDPQDASGTRQRDERRTAGVGGDRPHDPLAGPP